MRYTIALTAGFVLLATISVAMPWALWTLLSPATFWEKVVGLILECGLIIFLSVTNSMVFITYLDWLKTIFRTPR